MRGLFNPENPVWRFIGNIADMFLLSVFWYVSCLLVIPGGAGTTAMYYTTMKIVSHNEDYTTASFFRSFKANFKQATLLWLGTLAIGGLLTVDILWAVNSGSRMGFYLLPALCIVALLFLMAASFLYPLLARVENSTAAIVKMALAMTARNPLPIFSALLLTVGILLLGVFVFWPVLLIAPGFSAYLNAYLYNRILAKYDLSL